MASSAVQICNRALYRLGLDSIASLAGTDHTSVICNELYAQVRDYLLNRYEWSFAVTRAELAELSVDNLTEYSYVYQEPSDLFRPIALLDENYAVSSEGWVREENRIFTDLTPAYLKYVKQVSDVAQFSEDFTESLVARLAWEACPALTSSGNKQTRDRLYQEYLVAIRNAKDIDAMVSRQDEAEPTMWTDVH